MFQRNEWHRYRSETCWYRSMSFTAREQPAEYFREFRQMQEAHYSGEYSNTFTCLRVICGNTPNLTDILNKYLISCSSKSLFLVLLSQLRIRVYLTVSRLRRPMSSSLSYLQSSSVNSLLSHFLLLSSLWYSHTISLVSLWFFFSLAMLPLFASASYSLTSVQNVQNIGLICNLSAVWNFTK